MRASIRQRLLVLVLLVAIPLMAATVFVIYQLAIGQRDSQREAMLGSARILTAFVDSEIETYLAIARTLAAAPSLRTGNLRGFYDMAVQAMSHWPNAWLILVDRNDKQLLNTTQPFESSLPRIANTGSHHKAIESKQPVISDVFRGQMAQRQIVALYYPAFVSEGVAYDIIIAIDPIQFARVLRAQRLPNGWLSGVMDRNGNFVARTRDHENYVGRPASSGWRAAAKTGQEGIFENISIEGEPLYLAFVNSPATGWSISIAATQAVMMEPFRSSLVLVGVIAGALLTLSLGFAYWFGRRIVSPLVILREAALAMLRGEKRFIGFTGLAEADEALRAFDTAASTILEREEQFHTLADSIPQLAWMAAADGSIIWYNRRWYEFTGADFEQTKGLGWYSIVDPTSVGAVTERFQSAIKRGNTWEDTFALRGADGRYRWFLSRAIPVRDRTDSVVRWFGTNTDISEQKQAADRQRLMTDELNHRVKNTLAVIQTMATVTSRTATNIAEFSKGFVARIMSLSRTHNILTDGQWEAADLRDILQNELSSFDDDNGSRFQLQGPAIRLPPKMAVDFGMIIHELVTNAVKHGSLSRAEGSLEVRWAISTQGANPSVELEWIERHGPQIKKPNKLGFGSRLIQGLVTESFRGHVNFDFAADGLRCSLRFSAPAIEPQGRNVSAAFHDLL